MNAHKMKTRVPAYGLADSGALIDAVRSRVTWIKKKGRCDPKVSSAAIERNQKDAEDYRSTAKAGLDGLSVDFESPAFSLTALRDASSALIDLHDALRDVAAYQFLCEEDEFNRGVVRLPTPSAVRDDMDRLSPNNRRRALEVVEHLLRKQQQGHE